MDKVIDIMSSKQKTMIVLLFDAAIAIISCYLSISLRLDDFMPAIFLDLNGRLIFCSIIITQVITFYYTGLYKGIWRYSSIYDLLKLIKGVTFAVALSVTLLGLTRHLSFFPRTSFVINWLLLVIGLGGGRLIYRLWRDGLLVKLQSSNRENVLIVGAGSGGQNLLREIRDNPSLRMNPVAIVDDDNGKQKKFLHGIEVKGTVSEIERIIQRYQVNKVLIAIPSATSEQINRIVDSCKNLNVTFKILPKISEILDFEHNIKLSHFRNIRIEDLLGRKEIHLDLNAIGMLISNKTILVTGAGGSIGSEICHQIARFRPSRLILFEISELFLYNLEKSLLKNFPDLRFISLIGDIRNAARVDEVFSKFSPNLVIHAAAYKHVPIMEDNPQEAISTNVLGTKILAETALKHSCERFVMISTDKAINPTSIMGTSKRIAELVCQHLQTKTSTVKTKFITVRFGNVLGSSGSVVPLFTEQIQNGGPITITHKDVKRYFMSIPEASQLVLQASTLCEGGEIFILEMGEPVYITDLAKKMIRLAGLKENVDIKIEYTGLRPGEKLFEELLSSNENELATQHPLVKRAKGNAPSSTFEQDLKELLETKIWDNESRLILIKKIVREYSPQKEEILDPKIQSRIPSESSPKQIHLS